MSQHPFLKSIRPVNLLSFGPNTQEIELRPLNILIGPNGSGKSNLIEIIGLLSKLPDRDPWSDVIQTGGAREWTWKGKNSENGLPSLSIEAEGYPYLDEIPDFRPIIADYSRTVTSTPELAKQTAKPIAYSIELREKDGAFEVVQEQFKELDRRDSDPIHPAWFSREGWIGHLHNTALDHSSPDLYPNLPTSRSVLSLLGGGANISGHIFHIQDFAEKLEQFGLYRDWVFGAKSEVRDIQPIGLESYKLVPGSSNLAQVLKAWRDRGDQAVFDRLLDLLQKFYAPVKDVDVELVGTHVRIMIKEEGLSSRTPADRLSDGTLRWLMLLIVLLDPVPPPVICLDEPELGLHPDTLPMLADLLVEASTRTQLIVTTHSRSFIDAFTDMPETVCICEKVEGATVIERLDKERLQVWLDKYSLGRLWTSGEIGGNRW